MALKYLKNTEVNIHNALIMTEDFNIKNRDWDPGYPHYSAHSDILIEITNSFDLRISFSVYQILTHYADNTNNSNSVLTLCFFVQIQSKLTPTLHYQNPNIYQIILF